MLESAAMKKIIAIVFITTATALISGQVAAAPSADEEQRIKAWEQGLRYMPGTPSFVPLIDACIEAAASVIAHPFLSDEFLAEERDNIRRLGCALTRKERIIAKGGAKSWPIHIETAAHVAIARTAESSCSRNLILQSRQRSSVTFGNAR